LSRIAFTIVYEGLHHLKHKNFAEKMAKMFDAWIVVEGYSLPYGSTNWCKKLDVPANSQDGTIEFMQAFARVHSNVYFYSATNFYSGKDDQVNVVIDILKKIAPFDKRQGKEIFLWEVDVDEHWSEFDIQTAENIARKSTAIGFSFPFNHYVGEGLIAKGTWGSGYLNRLWKWQGQLFKSHEPALLVGQRKVEPIDVVRFEHYSYYFEKDVKFKSLSYSGHEQVYQNWLKLKEQKEFPLHISFLFGKDSQIGKSKSFIHKIAA